MITVISPVSASPSTVSVSMEHGGAGGGGVRLNEKMWETDGGGSGRKKKGALQIFCAELLSELGEDKREGRSTGDS